MNKFKKLVFIVSVALFTLEGMTVSAQQNILRENGNQTDATSLQSLNGLIASQRFGASVSNCGDLNGDGYDDIISGAHLTNSNTGRAYIYFGGNNMSSSPSIVLNGESANSYFGISVSDAGDVNADGYNDVIVGAYGYSSNTGRAYIYFGGYNMDNIADVVISAPVTSSFGYSVSSAGDMNGDGFSDVIVSAHTYSSNKGRAYIYYGGLIMDNSPDKVLEGVASGGFFGFSLSGAGDVNGDGYSDVLVGAYAVSSFTGSAYLYFGGSDMDTISDVTFTGEGTSNFFGQSVSKAGDVNGDGYSDMLIGASFYSGQTGRAYLFYGGGSPDNTADVIFTGELSGSNFGRGVSGAGDVNGDGYSDILIGASSYNGNKGRAYLYYGNVSMNNVSDVIFKGENANDYFGFSVAGGGDINGDGYKDFMVGAYGVNSNKGKVYIYKNSLTGNDIYDLAVYGDPNSEVGCSVSDAGDINGDGYDDYIVGARYGGTFYEGRAFIYLGSANPDTTADIILNGKSANSFFGSSVSGAGDVNADGYADIIIGSPEFNSSQGRVYIYFGGVNMDTIPDVIMTGVASLNRFGESVSSAGDMNGDGYSDVIVGTPGYASSRGRILVYFGGSAMDTIADITWTGSIANDLLGYSVSDAGDVNNDGYSDVIFSAPNYSNYKGLVIIFLGNLGFPVSIIGDNDFDQIGLSVSGAGDINGDGFSDIIFGAPFSNNDFGKAYVCYGSTLMDTVIDLEFGGELYNFANSVSAAGDINNDGYGDLIISETGYYTNSGRAFVYFGGYQPDNIPDIILNNNFSGERFGNSVSSGGDINGDGLDDILAGAFTNSLYGGSSGAFYTYLSSAPSVKPLLISVKDVPNDQGGKVNLKWTRSAYDVIGNDMITDYLIQRSLPPGGGGFYWENIATIPATKESYYAYNDNT
ncbi:MAG: FG-GAP repeat protein, partial [Ignavibacteriae bacterium]|nr:FG-GAP repeat protein [Ignavibacteriota bacterium]